VTAQTIRDFVPLEIGGDLNWRSEDEAGADVGCSISASGQEHLADYKAKYRWTNVTAIEPSPTLLATRFTDPARQSPAAKIPGHEVSR
jgi:hypothetical protein